MKTWTLKNWGPWKTWETAGYRKKDKKTTEQNLLALKRLVSKPFQKIDIEAFYEDKKYAEEQT